MFRKTLWFLGITFFLSWGLIGCFIWFGGQLNSAGAQNLLMGFMVMPMIAVIIVQKFMYNGDVMDEYDVYFDFNKWYLYALLIPFGLSIVSMIVGAFMPGVTFSLGLEGMYERYAEQLSPTQLELIKRQLSSLSIHPYILTLFQGLVGAATINALIGFGEELGWRGLLYKAFKPLGFWSSSLLIGLIWGVWHIPVVMLGYNYPQNPGIGIWMMIIWCILISPLFQYIRLKSGSVVAVALLHGAISGSLSLSFMLLKGGDDLTIGLTGVAGLIVLGFVDVILLTIMMRENQYTDG